jgi:hypothetical protein
MDGDIILYVHLTPVMPELTTWNRGDREADLVRYGRRIRELPRRCAASLKGLVEGAAFWTGVVLPFLYVPMFVLGKGVQFVTFVGLLAFNYLAFIVGAGHDRQAAE